MEEIQHLSNRNLIYKISIDDKKTSNSTDIKIFFWNIYRFLDYNLTVVRILLTNHRKNRNHKSKNTPHCFSYQCPHNTNRTYLSHSRPFQPLHIIIMIIFMSSDSIFIRRHRTIHDIKRSEFWNPCKYFPKWGARKVLTLNLVGI